MTDFTVQFFIKIVFLQAKSRGSGGLQILICQNYTMDLLLCLTAFIRV